MPDNPGRDSWAWNNGTPIYSTTEYVIPEAPLALQLRIANLLQLAAFPRPIKGDKSDMVREFAIKEAVRLLGLTPHE